MKTDYLQSPVNRGFSQSGWGVVLMLVAVALLGTSCSSGWRNPWASLGPPAPAVLATGASVQQIVAAVNNNTARIQTYSASNASITVPGMPGPMLQGNIAIERPQRFRLRAGTALSGPELDLGSNEQLFWFWVKRNIPPALYYCRHEQFASSSARQVLPIEPAWLIDALGLITLDPNAAYEGPFGRSDGTLELRSQIASPSGTLTRLVVINPTTAQVMEQHLYDAAGSPVASAVAQRHRYYAEQQVSLPELVSITVPGAQLALTIDLGLIAVNQPIADPQAFTMPVIQGFPAVDLSTMAGPPPVAGAPPTAAVSPTSAASPTELIAPAAMPSPYARFRPPMVNAQPKPPFQSGVVPATWQPEGTSQPASMQTTISPVPLSNPGPATTPENNQPAIGRLPPNGVEF